MVAGLLGAAPGAAETFPAPLDPRQLEIRVWTAEERELPELERDVVRMLQLNPDSSFAHQLLSRVEVRLFSQDPGDLYQLKQASDLAQQAIDLDRKDAGGYVALADILDLMGNADRALRLLDEAEASGIEPNWRFYFTRARLAADEVKTDKVLGLLDTALAFVDSERRIVAPYVVAILQSESQGRELVAKLEQWQRRYPTPLFQLTAAITYSELGDYKTAHQLYERILKDDPANREAQINNAVLLYRNLGEPKRAALLLEALAADAKGHGAGTDGLNASGVKGRSVNGGLPTGTEAMVQAHLAAVYLQLKRYGDAETYFTKAVSQPGENLGIIDFATRTYRAAKEPARLVALIRRLNGTLLGSGVLHALLGETLSESLSQHDAAVAAFRDAIVLDPGRGDYYNGMGLAYYRQKAYADALKLFTTATDLDPNDATAHYNEACVLALMGRGDDALSTLAEALTLDPRLASNARGDADFRSLKSSLKFRDLVQGPSGGKTPGPLLGH